MTSYSDGQSIRFHSSLPVETYDRFGSVVFRAGENGEFVYSQWFPITVVNQVIPIPEFMQGGKGLAYSAEAVSGVTIDFEINKIDDFK